MATARESGAKPLVTPATIMYTVNGVEQLIDFHTVIQEEHSVQAQITKYPVQSGVHISSHSIRNNRVVGIKATISNIRMQVIRDGESDIVSGTDYGIGATNVIKKALDSLVTTGQECRVVTNLGEYFPVIFNSFNTVQKEGKVDSMDVNIIGEEVIKVTGGRYSAPGAVVFEVLTGAARDARAKALEEAGFGKVSDCTELSTADIDKDEGFIIKALDQAGNAVETVFRFLGNDPVSGSLGYAQDVLGLDVFGAKVSREEDACDDSLASKVKGGLEQIGGCLLDAADDAVETAVENFVETAMGDLQESIAGVFYDTVTMGSESGQALATAGLGCIVRGITGTESEFPYMPGESLPTTEEIMSGNIFGPDEGSTELSKSGGAFDKETLTKMVCKCKKDESEAVDKEAVGALP